MSPAERGLWARPAGRISARFALVAEHDRGYSTEVYPRNLAGQVALSCEHAEGRACGPGAGAGLELDSAAGAGQWLSLFTRLRLGLGSGGYGGGVELERAALQAILGPVALAAGRDVLALSPSARTELMWSDHAAPADHVRIGTARPLELAGVRVSLLWFVARLREPQTFAGTLVSGQRLQVELSDRLAVGASRLLQLGGRGAPHVGLREFFLEHFVREGDPAGVGISNNRLSFDAALALPGARVYYQLDFEDTRKQFLDTLRYTTDHLLGIEVAARGGSRFRGAVVELQQTGINSHEHVLFTTGMTNAGRTVGSPLGPQARSLYAQISIAAAQRLLLSPWAEAATFSSDAYDSPLEGNITLIRRGPSEQRLRGGLGARFAAGAVSFEAQGFVESVWGADLVPGARRANGGVLASVSFVPARWR